MTRLSQSLLEQLGVRLGHSDLKKLGYKAEKRPNNPNTYYKVPGLHTNIENCPKVVKYIRQVFLHNKKQELEKLLGRVSQQQQARLKEQVYRRSGGCCCRLATAASNVAKQGQPMLAGMSTSCLSLQLSV